MKDLIPFTFEASEVRVLSRDGEPWFILADVCRVLELSNPSMAAKGLYDDEITTIDTLNNTDGLTDPRAQTIRIINEPGLYSLILTSRKPSAKRFKKWVTAEVLSSIRKTGSYGVTRDPLEVLNDPSAMRGLLLTYSEKVLALQGELAELTPKVQAFKRLAEAEGGLCPADSAKALQVKPKQSIDWLSVRKWTYRRLGKSGLLAYQDKIQAGLLLHKVYEQPAGDGGVKLRERLLITPKGLTKLAEAFNAGINGTLL